MSLFAIQLEAAQREARASEPRPDPERPTAPVVGAPGREAAALECLAAARVLMRHTRSAQLWKDIIAALFKAGIVEIKKGP